MIIFNFFRSVRLSSLLLSIDLIKVYCAALSLATYVCLSAFVSEDIMVSYAYSQSLIVIFSAIIDKGVNVLNLNHKIKGKVLERNCHNVNIILFVFLAVSCFYLASTYNLTSFNSIIILLSIFLVLPFNVFLMRWNTVYKREGKLFVQSLHGELYFIAVRSFTVLFLSYYMSDIGLALSIFISPVLIVAFLKYRYPIHGLKVFEPKRTLCINAKFEKSSSQAYVLSVLVSVKNQLLGVLIPLIKPEMQAVFVVISRLYGVVVTIASGVLARVPYGVRLFSNDKKENLFYYSGLILLIVFIFVFVSPIWLPYALYVFSVTGLIDIYTYALVFLVGSGLIFSLASTLFQVIGRNFYALVLELLYVFLFCIFVFIQ
jgi:hypothetical protein